MNKKHGLIETFVTTLITFLWTVLHVSILLPRIKSRPIAMMAMCLFYILLVAIPFVVTKFSHLPIDWGFRKTNVLRQILIGIALALVFSLVLIGLPLLIGIDRESVLSSKSSSLGILAFRVFYAFVFVGMGEEILFRGYFFDRFHRITSSTLGAMICSSLLFGLWHYPNGHNIMQVLMTSLIGAVFALARAKGATTLSLGIAHGLYDACMIVLSFMLL